MKKDELITFIKEAKGIKKETPATKVKDSAKFKSKQDIIFLINVMGKPLPFPGGMANFKVGKNMLVQSTASAIVAEMKKFQVLPRICQV